MQDPLKQGLKQHLRKRRRLRKIIRMQDPLKQGLKHDYRGKKQSTKQLFECKIH